MFDERIEFAERTLVEQVADTLARGEFALLVLFGYPRLAAARERPLPVSLQFGQRVAFACRLVSPSTSLPPITLTRMTGSRDGRDKRLSLAGWAPASKSRKSHRYQRYTVGVVNLPLHTAVHREYLAGHVRGVLAGDEAHDTGHVLGGGEPAERDAVEYLLLRGVVVRGVVVALADVL